MGINERQALTLPGWNAGLLQQFLEFMVMRATRELTGFTALTPADHERRMTDAFLRQAVAASSHGMQPAHARDFQRLA